MPFVQEHVTVVSPSETELPRWSDGASRGQYVVVPDIDMLENMLRSPVVRFSGEIERVVIDGHMELDRFLYLISTLPDKFVGEILFIRRDGSGYLSSRELRSTRTVKAINEMEVEVYLRWHGLPARSRETYGPDADELPLH